MPPLHLIISRMAADDLDHVWSHIAVAASADRARRVITKILDAIDGLSEMPGMGHQRSDLPDRYRVWKVYKYLIIYRFDEKPIYVDRVVHGHRDVRRLFGQ